MAEKGKLLMTITGLTNPRGIAVNKDGVIAVAEGFGHCVSIFDKDGVKVRSFGTQGEAPGQFIRPHGLAFAKDGNIIVTDHHRLHKVSLEGRQIAQLGGVHSGTGQLQFTRPYGVTVHPSSGQIYVAEHGNNRVQIINDDYRGLTFKGYIEIPKATGLKLLQPWDVALDSICKVYVISGDKLRPDGVCDDWCIDIFNNNFRHIYRFGGSGQLCRPISIAIDIHNSVYVTEFETNRISKFGRVSVTTDGKDFSKDATEHIGKEVVEFNGPCGIEVDKFGVLYVSDAYNNRVIVLQTEV